jgi:hypothetical protein
MSQNLGPFRSNNPKCELMCLCSRKQYSRKIEMAGPYFVVLWCLFSRHLYLSIRRLAAQTCRCALTSCQWAPPVCLLAVLVHLKHSPQIQKSMDGSCCRAFQPLGNKCTINAYITSGNTDVSLTSCCSWSQSVYQHVFAWFFLRSLLHHEINSTINQNYEIQKTQWIISPLWWSRQ